MKISRKWLKNKAACHEAYVAFKLYEKELSTDIAVIDKAMVLDHFDWANWALVRLMNKKQKVRYAVYSAELVLNIFEKKYPHDKRPRNAIEAAKAYLKNPCKKTKNDAFTAYTAASTAATYTYAASAYTAYAASAAAAYTAAAAATTYTYTAYAASAAAAAADADATVYDADADRQIKTKIINYGKTLISRGR